MRRRRPHCRWLALLVLAGLAAGCETRDPKNPFDPNNPNTNGVPRLLEALAADGQVQLEWNLEGLEDANAVRLVRWLRGDPAQSTTLLEEGGRGGGLFLDDSLENDATYAYRLEVLTPGGEWIQTESDLATPGASEPWIGDAAGGGLLRLTPDGRDIRFQVDRFRDLLDLQIDFDGSVWGADYSNGEILHFGRDGSIVSAWPWAGSNTLAIDLSSAAVWVGSFDQQQVIRFDRAGHVQYRLENAGLVEDLAPGLFPEGGIWVASRFTGVTRILHDQVTRQWPEFEWPVSVAHDRQGWVWVVDRQRKSAAQILADGRVIWSDAEMVDPKDGELDGAGGFWVADPGRGGLLHLSGAGHEIGFLAVGAVDAVSLDPVHQHLWLVFREASEVRVITPAGLELVRADVGGRPVKVEGYWRP